MGSEAGRSGAQARELAVERYARQLRAAGYSEQQILTLVGPRVTSTLGESIGESTIGGGKEAVLAKTQPEYQRAIGRLQSVIARSGTSRQRISAGQELMQRQSFLDPFGSKRRIF